MTDLKPFFVLDGVETVDGQRVPPDRIVRLTDTSARFDLDAGKIVPLDQAPAKAGKADVPKGKSPADG